MTSTAADPDIADPDIAVPGIRRPRLRADHPLLRRDDGQLQLGIGEHAVLLGPVSAELIAWLRRFDGAHEWCRLQELAEDLAVEPARAHRLVHRIAAAGALDDAAAMPDSLRWRDRREREDMAGDIAAAGFAYGSSATANLVVERRLRVRIAVDGSGLLAQAVREAVDASGMLSTCEEDADLFIRTVSHPALADPEATGAHLPVSVFGDAGTAGPIVIPGRTGCLRCLHLHRRDADPSWPLLVLQLEQAAGRMDPLPVDRLLARATATAAVLLVRRWADDPLAPESWAGQVLEVHLPDAAIIRRPAPPHALCGCIWPVDRARTGSLEQIG